MNGGGRLRGYHQLLEKELVEAWRTSRVLVVVGLFLLIGIGSPLLTYYLPDIIRAFAPASMGLDIPPQTVADSVDQLLKNLVQFGALAAILVAMGAVANEKERGTAAFVLTKPATRLSFLTAKLIAIAMIFGLATLLAVAAAWAYTAILWSAPSIAGWLQLALVSWLATMVYVSITFLGSTLARSSLAAAGFGFGALIVLSIASAIPGLAGWLPAGLTAVARTLALDDPSANVDPARTIAVSLAIVAGCAALAVWRFRREEL
jgi:ABC-2 type transport system permease protein